MARADSGRQGRGDELAPLGEGIAAEDLRAGEAVAAAAAQTAPPTGQVERAPPSPSVRLRWFCVPGLQTLQYSIDGGAWVSVPYVVDDDEAPS
jgi:hypothetical protein